MNEQEYQEYIKNRIKRRKARQRRLKRQRLLLLFLMFVIFVLTGLLFGLHRHKLENPKAKYTLENIDAKCPMINVAKEQIGNEGGLPYWSWYGFNHHVEWCACFVSWVENENGYIKAGKAPKFASVPLGVEWFEANDLWIDGKEKPTPGDVIFFDWDGDGYGDHVGLVSNVIGERVFTIEGNSGDLCRRKRYVIGSKCILGYGHIEQK